MQNWQNKIELTCVVVVAVTSKVFVKNCMKHYWPDNQKLSFSFAVPGAGGCPVG